jgi:hypothetical protein
MFRNALAAVLAVPALFAAPAPLIAQHAPAPVNLNWFHGEWAGTVDFIGRPATGRLTVHPALSGSATELLYIADVAASGGKPAFRFEGRGTYLIKPDGNVTGVWADSFGNFHTLKGRTTEGELRVTWGDAMTEVGHSSYELSADGTLTVIDSAFVQGKVQVFGRSSYRRKP